MVVLKCIPRILSPQLLSVLARMGHGDEIGEPRACLCRLTSDRTAFTVLADANFPSASICKEGAELVRADGESSPVLQALF